MLDAKVGRTAAAAITLLELAYPNIPTTRPAGAGKLWLNDGSVQFTTAA